jgi:hypothetical protein
LARFQTLREFSQSWIPSSLANRFFPASTALSGVRAERIMLDRWQHWKAFRSWGFH